MHVYTVFLVSRRYLYRKYRDYWDWEFIESNSRSIVLDEMCFKEIILYIYVYIYICIYVYTYIYI